jgi:hypothetical protein
MNAIWSSRDYDIPVVIADEPPQRGSDGQMYQKVTHDGVPSFVPVSELFQK